MLSAGKNTSEDVLYIFSLQKQAAQISYISATPPLTSLGVSLWSMTAMYNKVKVRKKT